MWYVSKPGKLEKSVGESGFFYKHDSKVGHFSYIFLNFMAVFFLYAHPENCGKLTYVSESPGRIFNGMRGEARQPVKSGCRTICCPKLQRLRGDLWAREPYFKACGGGILVFFIKT